MLRHTLSCTTVILALALTTVFSSPARAGALENASFEVEFGPREDLNMWGDYGETFGEAYQVAAGADDRPKTARDGSRVLIINVPQNTWNGIWQQVSWPEKESYNLTGFYQILGDDLPEHCATFLKAEFYDGHDNKIGEEIGTERRMSTRDRWVADAVRGVTPAGTESIRCVVIGGHNPDGDPVVDRIFWDDVDLLK